MSDPASIVVIRLGAMGDVLHALPAAQSLKLSFPNARLSWIVRPKWTPLLEGNPYIDELVPYRKDEGIRARVHSLMRMRQLKPDLAIDFQGLIQSALIGRLSGPKTFWGLHRSIARESLASSLYTHVAKVEGPHRVDGNLQLVTATGATRITTDSWVPPGHPEGELPKTPFVLAAPLAGWGSKQWPVEHYRRLGEMLAAQGLTLVLNVAPSQKEGLAGFCLHTSSIEGLTDATRRAVAVIGVDSGPLHLAAALRKPGVAIFGPTDPAANGPYGGTIRVIRRPGVETTYKRNDAIHPAMRAVTPEQVFEQLMPQISLVSGRAS